MKTETKAKIFLFSIAATFIILINNIDILVTTCHGHSIFHMPPGYTLVTNGKKYTFIDPNGHRNNSPDKSKLKTRCDAWWDYDYEQARSGEWVPVKNQ